MILKTAVGDYKAHFHHQYGPWEKFKEPRWVTSCSLHSMPCAKKEWPCGTLSLTGTCVCNPTDDFDKPAGRVEALTRAMKSLPRETRTMLWKSYFEQAGNVPRRILRLTQTEIHYLLNCIETTYLSLNPRLQERLRKLLRH
jgi:hypothetical protein